MGDGIDRTLRKAFGTWMISSWAERSAALLQASLYPPTHNACSDSPLITSAMQRIGTDTSSVARSITRRTAVSLIPIVHMLEARAPSQCVALITSGPAMPGTAYLAPPE